MLSFSRITFRRCLTALILCSVFTPATVEAADETSLYTAPSKSFSLAFNYAGYEQSGFPKINSDLGVSFTVNHSYWLLKPGNHRFQLGIDVAWNDINYCNYKVNLRTFEGTTVRYTIHSGDVGIQAGLGMNLNITRDLRVHARACYNPAFAGLYESKKFHGAFANYGVVGLSVSWKCIGLGLDYRFGRAKYNDTISEILGDEDMSVAELNRPGSNNGKKFSANLSALRAAIILSF